MNRRARGATALSRLCVLLCLLVPGTSALAQSGYSIAVLPENHWSLDALRRLAGLGLTRPGWDVADRRPTQREVGDQLEYAWAAASGSPLAPLVDAWLEQYEREFVRRDGGLLPGVARGSSLGVGYRHATGRLSPGYGYENGHPYGDWNDATPLASRRAAFADVSAQLTPLPSLAARVTLDVSNPTELKEAYTIGRLGPIALWAGRRTLSRGSGIRQGIVLNDARVDGAGLRTVAALKLPWVLRHVGPVRIEVDGAQVDLRRPCHDPTIEGEAPPCEDAWLLATRGMVQPHDRLALGVTRAVIFGGEGNTDVDAFAFFSILIGKHAGNVSELDNQVVSVDVSFRPPTERWLPMRGYVEWGFDDSAGAFTNVPGVLAGIELPAVPGVPALSLALEGAGFKRSCCGNPIWYRHSVFHDGWVLDSTPLGHELGGHGQELSLHGSLVGANGRIRLYANAFVRRRGEENLFASTREGRSQGGTFRVDYGFKDGIELSAGAGLEHGAGWREVEGRVNLRVFP